VGVTEPSGQLELAGDERIQEYPPRAMTGWETLVEGHGVFKASASSTLDPNNWPAYEAFNKTITNTSDAWVTPGTSYYTSNGLPTTSVSKFYDGVAGEWIQLDLPYSIKLKQAYLYEREPQGASYEPNTSPRDVRILGKKQKSEEWVEIFSVSDLVYTQQQGNTPKILNVNSNDFYSSYVLQLTRIGGPDGADAPPYGWGEVAELKYYGTPGPTTLDKGSLTLGRSLDVPRVSRYDVDTETPRPEKLVVDFDTTVNSSPTDISGKGNHGTLIGATYSAPDKAFDFSATNNVIYAPSLSPTMTGDIIVSMSCWFKLDNSATRQSIMWIGSDASDADFIDIRVKGGHIGLSMGYDPDTNMLGIKTGSILESNRWYHVVGVKSGTGAINSTTTNTMLQLYLDGVKLNTVDGGRTETAGLNIPTDHNFLVVGAGNETGSVLPMAGQVSNPKIYNVALEPSEVKKLYNLGRTGRSMVISDTAVGIGKAPEAQLDVRGNLKVSGTISSNSPGWSYWRNSSADINDVIYNSATDGPVGGFSTLASFSQNWETGISGSIADRGTGHNFNPTTGTYTAPEKGVYMVNFSFSIDNGGGGDDSMYVQFQTAGNSGGGGGWETGGAFVNRTSSTNAYMLFNPEFSTRSGLEDCWSISDILLLDAGSTVNVRLENVSSSSSLTFLRCNFSGFKIA
jgi:hypothetical protein